MIGLKSLSAEITISDEDLLQTCFDVSPLVKQKLVDSFEQLVMSEDLSITKSKAKNETTFRVQLAVTYPTK